jgi:predicted amidohydrolase
MHLFDVDLPGRTYRESAGTAAGDAPVTWDGGDLGVHGLSICYDLRFPELYRALAARGADVLWVPAAFTVPTGRVHWQVLLRARAIENTCYVVAPAQVGAHGSRRESYGHAVIIDPWGDVLADAGGTEPGVVMAEVSGARLAEVRGQIPSLKHRRLES